MELAKPKIYTEEDYYSLPENIRAELIDGDLIYNQTDLSRESVWVYYFEESKFKAEAHSFKDEIKVNIYDDLYIDFLLCWAEYYFNKWLYKENTKNSR